MATSNRPAPKLPATKVPPPVPKGANPEKHDEGLIDESVDESFPASDPSAIAQPGSTLSNKKTRKPSTT